MKRMLMGVIAVAVAVTFSAPSFAGEGKKGKKGKKDEKKDGGKLVQMLNADEKKGGHADTFGDKKKDELKDEKGK